ncbi:MAG: cupredoxin family copper-binding protein [Ilumatobacteraceae bacterium]
MNIARPLRITAAGALLTGGLLHLQLYFDGYRSIDKIGSSFLLNAIASGGVAAAVAVRKEWLVKLAGIGVAAGTLVAFALSRRGDGLFSFREQGLAPSPQALLALVVEIVAIVALAVTFAPSIEDRSEPRPLALGVSVAMAGVALIGLGAYWADHHESIAFSTSNGVRIQDFVFEPATLTVTRGSTVEWTNRDPFDHSVVATDVSFHSDSIGQGQTFSHTFDIAGQFSFVCGIHPQMKGTITVTG